MGPWVIREILPADDVAVRHVHSVVYLGGQPTDPEDPMLSPGEWGALAERDGFVGGAFYVFPLRLTRGSARIQAGGIAAVAVMPEVRNEGVGSLLMRHSLQAMRDKGCGLAALYAFRESYYRRFGYEQAGVRYQIRCPQHRFPRIQQELSVRQISASELHQLKPCYEAFIAQVNGANDRSDWQWTNRMGKKNPLIFAAGDPVEAYAWSSMAGGFWDDLEIGELIWSSPRGYQSILAFLGGWMSNRKSLTWSEPSRSPFLQSYMDQGIEVSIHRQPMFRMLDIKLCFESLQTNESGEFTFAVDDPDLPENQGPWKVQFGPAGISVTPSERAELHGTIRHWTQAFLGEPSLDRLAATGQIHWESPEALHNAKRLLPPGPVYLTEFF